MSSTPGTIELRTTYCGRCCSFSSMSRGTSPTASMPNKAGMMKTAGNGGFTACKVRRWGRWFRRELLKPMTTLGSISILPISGEQAVTSIKWISKRLFSICIG